MKDTELQAQIHAAMAKENVALTVLGTAKFVAILDGEVAFFRETSEACQRDLEKIKPHFTYPICYWQTIEEHSKAVKREKDLETVAAFMGLEYKECWIQHEHEYSSNEVELVTEKDLGWTSDGQYGVSELDYDAGLEALIQPILKIGETSHCLEGGTFDVNWKFGNENSFEILHEGELVIGAKGDDSDMVFNTIVLFIEWHNKLKEDESRSKS